MTCRDHLRLGSATDSRKDRAGFDDLAENRDDTMFHIDLSQVVTQPSPCRTRVILRSNVFEGMIDRFPCGGEHMMTISADSVQNARPSQ